MIILFDLIFILFSILYLPVFLLKGKAHKGFLQRLGFFSKDLKKSLQGKNNLWLHAVSVGEVQAVSSLLDYLRNKHPLKRIVISTVTPTGNKLARSLVKSDELVIYFPLDLSFIVSRFVANINPEFFLTTETEIWPNLFLALKQKDIPIFLVNGRISQRSFKGYKLVKPFIKGVLDSVRLFCMQTELDATRIKELGAASGKIEITGNLKFDAQSYSNKYQLPDLGFKSNDLLLIAGSTHSGEEEIIISAFKNLSKTISNLRLLIAPRHIERCSLVEEILDKENIAHKRFSQLLKKRNEASVIVLDTIGDLSSLYALADVVFMGGSLVKKGGHNIIEPAMFGKPIIFGQFMFNFKDIARLFLDRGAAIKINTEGDFVDIAKKLLLDKNAREQIGQLAKKIVEENKGAAEKTAELISKNFFLKC